MLFACSRRQSFRLSKALFFFSVIISVSRHWNSFSTDGNRQSPFWFEITIFYWHIYQVFFFREREVLELDSNFFFVLRSLKITDQCSQNRTTEHNKNDIYWASHGIIETRNILRRFELAQEEGKFSSRPRQKRKSRWRQRWWRRRSRKQISSALWLNKQNKLFLLFFSDWNGKPFDQWPRSGLRPEQWRDWLTQLILERLRDGKEDAKKNSLSKAAEILAEEINEKKEMTSWRWGNERRRVISNEIAIKEDKKPSHSENDRHGLGVGLRNDGRWSVEDRWLERKVQMWFGELLGLWVWLLSKLWTQN